MSVKPTEPEAWPTDGEYDPEQIKRCHAELMERGGLIGVLYRRQVRRVRELKERVCNLETTQQ